MFARIDFPLADGQRLQARFAAPLKVWRADRLAQVAAVLAEAERAAAQGLWVVGFVAYEAAPAFDPALSVFPAQDGQPLALFAAYRQAEPAAERDQSDESDQSDGSAKAALPDFFCKSWQAAASESDVAAQVQAIRTGIAAGDFYQINLTTRLSSPFAGNPEAFFEALQASQPGAYAACLDWGDGQILSVSPELFFSRQGQRIVTRPMKGTAPRHADPAADLAAAEHLRQSVKERAENLMIVDLLRNDLARIAEIGSVAVESLFEVEPWSSVWQMTSTIAAEARPGIGLPELFGALFPCGSVTGAPKVAAMAAIARLEAAPRGVYCGAIGVLQPGGDAVFSVAIRSVAIAQGTATCGIGSAITIDSTAEGEHGEYAEWMAKRRFLLRASAPFSLLETLRLENGEYPRLARHLQRLLGSAAWFGFAADEARLRQALRDLARELSGQETAASEGQSAPERAPEGGAESTAARWRVRLLLDRSGGVSCQAFPLEASPAEVLVRLADRPIGGQPEFLRHKTTERSVYEAFADLPAGVFDTLLFNPRGELTEFTRGNVFLEQEGVLLTPPLRCGLLPGVLRAELLASGRAREVVLRRERLLDPAAGQWWFGNSLRGLLPVRFISPP